MSGPPSAESSRRAGRRASGGAGGADLDLRRADRVARGLGARGDAVVVDVARSAADLEDAAGVVVEQPEQLDVVGADRLDVDAGVAAERLVVAILVLLAAGAEAVRVLDRRAERGHVAQLVARQDAEPAGLLEQRLLLGGGRRLAAADQRARRGGIGLALRGVLDGQRQLLAERGLERRRIDQLAARDAGLAGHRRRDPRGRRGRGLMGLLLLLGLALGLLRARALAVAAGGQQGASEEGGGGGGREQDTHAKRS